MLQRIYGTAFATRKELKQHLELLEEAKRRDHRRLGRELGLFSIEEEAGAGMVIYHPKGALLRSLIENFERREHLKRGYQMVMGPQMLKADLWKRSGHWDNYRDNMYFTEVEGQMLRHQAHELPGPHADLQIADPELPGPAAALLRTGHRACATSVPGCCTASPGCASSPRTMPISCACRSRWKAKSWGS